MYVCMYAWPCQGGAWSVLYLSHQNPDLDSGDYVCDLTLVGLLQLLGAHRVAEFPLRRAIHKTLQDFHAADAQRLRDSLYGKGCVLR